jgi:phosphoglucomutase
MHVEAVLGGLGLEVTTVPEQREPDGDFPTVSFPNPEEPAALKLALDLGKKLGADVVMATDPDADRLGIAMPDGKGGFILVTGNQLGSLLADYVLLSLKEFGSMPKKAATVRSIVTTDLQRRIAESYGATSFECLTGFKWIADLARRFETDGLGYEFVYGTEESYGYLVETEVRDKDGISAAAMTAEMTLYWRSKGKSLLDRLNELYVQHGYYEEIGISKYFEGSSGGAIIAGIMARLRSDPPKTLGGVKVERIRDVDALVAWDADRPDKKEKVDLPSSNVLQFYLEDGSIVSARPSGTEPKIKFYASCRNETKGDLEGAKKRVKAELAGIDRDLKAILDAR